jgi:polysaccharide deacetylase 2 family uncharacterized protein YibQ
MSRQSLIRHWSVRHWPEIAFAMLFGGGLLLGGGAALAALPNVLDAAVPGMAGQADADKGVVRLTLPPGYAQTAETVPAVAITPAVAPARLAPVIAICMDDLGEDLATTVKATALPKEIALSFLPYAERTPSLAEAASRKGHLVLAHVPMQALNGSDPGAMGLKPGMSTDEITKRMGWNLARVPGLVGINNHEGSRFTADAAALKPVMAVLLARHLFFFDSRTGPRSAVREAARAAGVTTAARDIFLDDDPRPGAISAQLDALARQAKRTGAAIAIGHPREATLKLLAAWLAEDHGVTLVPLDEAMRLKTEHAASLASR